MASASAAGRRPGRAVVIDLRPVLFLLGWFLAALAAIMMVPALVDAAAGNPDWATFLTSSLLTLFVGVSLALATRQQGQITLARRQAFLFTRASSGSRPPPSARCPSPSPTT
jgi:Trk-type K+ transport system membrane component